MTDTDIYHRRAAIQVPRLLACQDREPHSLTYGCCDRTYWAWKFSDFPGARYQEAVYALAHLYAHPVAEGDWRGNGRILEWAGAGIRYWQGLAHGDGSFDEAYPHEHSLAATAFSAFYVGEAVALLGDALDADLRRSALAALRRAGDWLCRSDETHGVLSNHLAAAAAALLTIDGLDGTGRYRARSGHFTERVLTRQSGEGWYEEYGGADPGYQTATTFYLAHVWQRTGDARLLESLGRSVRFVSHFVHPNGTLGGEYGSRNTELYYPAGFEILSPEIPEAAAVASFMRNAMGDGGGPLAAIDAQNGFPLLNNYLIAGRHANDRAAATPLPCQTTLSATFPGAGLHVRSTARYFAVVGLSKGGVIRLYPKQGGAGAKADCGYWGRMTSGAVVTSQALDGASAWTEEGERITLSARFSHVNQVLPGPWRFALFRVVCLCLGRVPVVARAVKRLLVHLLVTRRRRVPIRLERTITFEVDGVTVADVLSGEGLRQAAELWPGAKFSAIHMGSARYFHPQELAFGGSDRLSLDAAQIRRGEPFRCSRAIHVGEDD